MSTPLTIYFMVGSLIGILIAWPARSAPIWFVMMVLAIVVGWPLIVVAVLIHVCVEIIKDQKIKRG